MKTQLTFLLLILLSASCTKQKNEDLLLPDPTSVCIDGVKIITMPFTDKGSSWDPLSEADLFFTIETSGGTLYAYDIAKRKENAKQNDLPYSFAMSPYELPLINQYYHIRIYDYDFPDENDLVADVLFNPEEFKTERPLSKKIPGTDAIIEVSFTWR